mmetsp:Transcript_17763/g.35054  ORF Transcript_17763/g.35054 Transcript_17763/m.35054 type:complete len:215 (+) Transcript_17763:130-774(+)
MIDILLAKVKTVLVFCSAVDNLVFKSVIKAWKQSLDKSLEDNRGWDTVAKEVIQPGPRCEQAIWALVFTNLFCERTNVDFPIRKLEFITFPGCYTLGFCHKESTTQIALRGLCNGSASTRAQTHALLLSNSLQDRTNLLVRWCGNTNGQAARTKRVNDFTEVFTAENQAAAADIFFHGTAKTVLRSLCQVVTITEEDNLKIGFALACTLGCICC